MEYKNSMKGHCAIATGATGGIGLCFCRELASRGCNLLMTDLSAERLTSTAGELSEEFPGITINTLAVNLCDNDACGVIEKACDNLRIDPDILINNAGIFSFKTVADTPTEKIDCYIDLHVRAVTTLSRWFALRRKQKGSGRILNMSSMSCWMPMPGIAMYAATKAYIRVFSRALHYEMRDYGVTVTVACPGGIATDLFGLPKRLQRLAVRIGALWTPERLARKAVTKLMKGKKQYINGLLNRIAIVAVGSTPTWIRMQIKHNLLDKC